MGDLSLPADPAGPAVEVAAPRVGRDRRRRPTPMLSRYWLRGRRRSGGRRAGEDANVYVDRYSRGETLALLWLVSASILDLVLTLAHIDAGGGEANPVMGWFLTRFGTLGFVVSKLGITAAAGLFLLVHCRFRGSFRGLCLLGVMYAGVLGYHVLAILDRG
ncbi:MAG: DUF5658 family protein [Planctomycetota bacterium]